MGYDVVDRQLVINPDEAETIRRVFQLYLEEGNVPALLDRLGRENIRTATRSRPRAENMAAGHSPEATSTSCCPTRSTSAGCRTRRLASGAA